VAKLRKNNLEKYLRQFAKNIIRKGKQILKAKGKEGKLSNSLNYRLEATNKGYNLVFKGADYAAFVDKGVSGTKTTRTFHNIDGKRKRSPFKYTTKQPPASALDKWIVRKNLKGTRDEKGRFVSRKSLQFLIARSIKSKGLAATSFFSKPMSIELAKLDTELLDNFKTDIITHFETIEL
jgi:hypothetical protein